MYSSRGNVLECTNNSCYQVAWLILCFLHLLEILILYGAQDINMFLVQDWPSLTPPTSQCLTNLFVKEGFYRITVFDSCPWHLHLLYYVVVSLSLEPLPHSTFDVVDSKINIKMYLIYLIVISLLKSCRTVQVRFDFLSIVSEPKWRTL